MNRAIVVMAALALVVRVSSGQSSQPNSDTRDAAPGVAGSVAPKNEPGEALRGSVEKAATTQHVLKLAERTLPYRATAANMLMKNDEGETKGSVFFVAYDLLTDAPAAASTATGNAPATTSAPALADGKPEDRPLTFVFNGGPGAAAVWLHLGTAGPRRIKLGPDGFAPPPPYSLADNEDTWLDFTDMVFVDPVGTGFSRPAKGEKGDQFYGVKEDIRWMSEFIRLYLTMYKRWGSPKFLAGESYGTTRAAGLSEQLLERHGITLNGIVLISTVLSFQTLSFKQGNDLPYVLYLPTYAAIAKFHQRLGPNAPDVESLVREVEEWATTEYAIALARGDGLSNERREQVARRLSAYTGLPQELILQSNLRIDPGVFQKKLLADRRQTVGRFDGRITGVDLSPIETWPDYDPSLTQYLPVYSGTFNDYVQRALEYQSALPYEVLSDRVRPWKFGEEGTGFLNVVDDLRSAMAKNPFLKVMFASGYFDLATPHFATRYTIEHMNVGPLQANIVEKRYPGGHMLYHYPPSRAKLHEDIAQFVRTATATR
jgi:carboxypeptidase C (cathepsin A)